MLKLANKDTNRITIPHLSIFFIQKKWLILIVQKYQNNIFNLKAAQNKIFTNESIYFLLEFYLFNFYNATNMKNL